MESSTISTSFINNTEIDSAKSNDTDNLAFSDSVKTISLCRVLPDQKRLIRLADLDTEKKFNVFYKDEYALDNFENIKIIHRNDNLLKSGSYGIWAWTAEPNYNNPSKAYTKSNYISQIEPIEITFINEAVNLDNLVDLLKEGLNYVPHSRKVLFSISKTPKEYIGLLCNNEELSIIKDKTTISKNCTKLPVYKFTDDEILDLDDDGLQLFFYNKASIGISKNFYFLKRPIEIVKEIVLSSVSWKNYESRTLTRQEFRDFKDFLNGIPIKDVIYDIQTKCSCSESRAEELLNLFLDQITKYIDGDSISDEIIRSFVNSDLLIQEKVKKVIREDWEKENENELAKAQNELAVYKEELKSVFRNLNKAKEILKDTKLEKERLDILITEKEKLAKEVEDGVAERIKKAQKNVADFIADMTFVSGLRDQRVDYLTNGLVEPITATYEVNPEFKKSDELEILNSWKEVISIVAEELIEAGIREEYNSDLVTFLCAAYIEKQPILLIGPNSIDIVEAFSTAINAHKYGVLNCEGNYSNQIVSEIGEDGENIVLINNLLASGWINRLPEILSQKNIFYIVTHPYIEDIQVEPKSLYEFVLPLFSEFFVNKRATGNYYGGYFSNDFKSDLDIKNERKKIKIFSEFSLSPIIENRFNNLINTMNALSSDPKINDDREFLFAILPMAYATLKINELKEIIEDPRKKIVISKKLKEDLSYLLGKFDG